VPIISNQDALIFYRTVGEGEPLVLLHSLLCSGQMWSGQVCALRNGYRIINVDLRGHGRSGPADHHCTLYDLVGDVIAVLDELQIERAIWCGLSVGGMIALRAALIHPERVSALVIADSDAGAETAWRRLKYRALGTGARLLGVGPMAPSVARLMFGPATRRRNPGLVEQWKRDLGDLDVPTVLRLLDAVVERDSILDRLGQITVPSLVLVGEEDRVLPPASSRRMQRQMPGARYEVISGAGHLSALEQPARVTRAMEVHLLESVAPRRRDGVTI
jgi:pimeloyl-ACP methyl ester carboxylesterase